MTEPTTKRRRWFRYSMRTMLVVVTVLCVLLALVIVPAERQRRTVQKIRALGSASKAVYDYEYEGRRGWGAELRGPEWLRRWIGVDYFQHVVSVHLQLSPGGEVTPDDLSNLSGLRHLAVYGMPITDDGLHKLARLRNLESLSFGDSSEITDRGLEHLSSLTELTHLFVASNQITGEGLRPFAAPGKLESLMLTSDNITPLGMEAVARFANLGRLSLCSGPH